MIKYRCGYCEAFRPNEECTHMTKEGGEWVSTDHLVLNNPKKSTFKDVKVKILDNSILEAEAAEDIKTGDFLTVKYNKKTGKFKARKWKPK